MCHIKHLCNIVCSALVSYCCSALILLSFNCVTQLYLYTQLCLVTWLMCCYLAHRFTWLICLHSAHMSLLGSYVFTQLICLHSAHMSSLGSYVFTRLICLYLAPMSLLSSYVFLLSSVCSLGSYTFYLAYIKIVRD